MSINHKKKTLAFGFMENFKKPTVLNMFNEQKNMNNQVKTSEKYEKWE